MTKKIASCEPIEEDHFEDVKEGTVCDVSRKTISEHCHDNGSGGVRICEPLLLDMLHEDFVDKKSSAPLDQECITQIYTASGQENDNLGTSAWIRLDDNNVLKHKPLIQNQEDYNVTYVTREHDDPGMPDETELSIHNTQEEHEFDLQSKSTRQQKVNYQPEVYKERNYEKGKIKERYTMYEYCNKVSCSYCYYWILISPVYASLRSFSQDILLYMYVYVIILIMLHHTM